MYIITVLSYLSSSVIIITQHYKQHQQASPIRGSPRDVPAVGIAAAPTLGASSRESSPIRSSALVAYAPAQSAAVELARREVAASLSSPSLRETRSIMPIVPSEVRVGRPLSVGRPVGRPAIAAHPRGVSPAPYGVSSMKYATDITAPLSIAGIGAASSMPAATLGGSIEGESLERRIARLSAEVAASRDRSARPLK